MKAMLRYFAPLLVLAGGAACSDDTAPSDTGTLVVRLTDAPSDDLESATIWVSEVSVNASGGADVIISSTPDVAYDLLDLQNGITATIGTASIPTGTYHQVRLLVDSARVVLKAGHTFSDGTNTAKLLVPSGSQTGIKVNISPPVSVTEGQTVLVVDFDVSQSFVFQGPSDHPNGILFKPVLHATVQDVAASISGTVTPASSNATLYAIVGIDTVGTAFANTTTGAYTLQFLPPGNYVVGVKATGFQDAVSAAIVLTNAQALTGVNFVLVPAP